MNGSRLKIVHVFRAPLGGLFRHVIDLAGEQSARGHDVGMFFDEGGKDARVDAAIAGIAGGLKLGVGLAPIARRPGPSDFWALKSFQNWLEGVRPDVVHGHGAKGGLLARIAGKLSTAERRPIVVYTPHGGSFNYRPGGLAHGFYMVVERALAPATDVFLFESDFIAGRFDSAVGEVHALRRRAFNGLKPAEFEPLPLDPDAAELLYIGELREAKGVDTLIGAFSRLEGRVRLAIVGSGPDRAAFEALTASLGIAGRVRFHGPLPARRAFALGGTLVVPSRQESLPYIVLEAAAAAKPIIATSVGGIPEIFGPFASRLIPPDDIAALADALTMMLTRNEASRQRDAEALRTYVAGRFSIRAMTDAVLAAYNEALQRRGAGPAPAIRRLHPQA